MLLTATWNAVIQSAWVAIAPSTDKLRGPFFNHSQESKIAVHAIYTRHPGQLAILAKSTPFPRRDRSTQLISGHQSGFPISMVRLLSCLASLFLLLLLGHSSRRRLPLVLALVICLAVELSQVILPQLCPVVSINNTHADRVLRVPVSDMSVSRLNLTYLIDFNENHLLRTLQVNFVLLIVNQASHRVNDDVPLERLVVAYARPNGELQSQKSQQCPHQSQS